MSVPSWARVGAKCVCVDKSPGIISSGEGILPTDIFTILRTRMCGDVPAAQLRNERSGDENGFLEWSRLSRYRPLTESDLAIFQGIADTAGVDEAARVLDGATA